MNEHPGQRAADALVDERERQAEDEDRRDARAAARARARTAPPSAAPCAIGPEALAEGRGEQAAEEQLLDDRADERERHARRAPRRRSAEAPGGRDASGARPCSRAAWRIGSSSGAHGERPDTVSEREADRARPGAPARRGRARAARRPSAAQPRRTAAPIAAYSAIVSSIAVGRVDDVGVLRARGRTARPRATKYETSTTPATTSRFAAGHAQARDRARRAGSCRHPEARRRARARSRSESARAAAAVEQQRREACRRGARRRRSRGRRRRGRSARPRRRDARARPGTAAGRASRRRPRPP